MFICLQTHLPFCAALSKIPGFGPSFPRVRKAAVGVYQTLENLHQCSRIINTSRFKMLRKLHQGCGTSQALKKPRGGICEWGEKSFGDLKTQQASIRRGQEWMLLGQGIWELPELGGEEGRRILVLSNQKLLLTGSWEGLRFCLE